MRRFALLSFAALTVVLATAVAGFGPTAVAGYQPTAARLAAGVGLDAAPDDSDLSPYRPLPASPGHAPDLQTDHPGPGDGMTPPSGAAGGHGPSAALAPTADLPADGLTVYSYEPADRIDLSASLTSILDPPRAG